MNPQIQTLLRLLEDARFEFPVAIYQDDAPEIGDVIAADAFDVPLPGGIAISQRLGAILWPQSFKPMTVLTGIIDDCDSQERRAELPDDTVWYLPAKARSRNGVPSSTLAAAPHSSHHDLRVTRPRAGTMKPDLQTQTQTLTQIQTLVQLLEAAAFEYPVAVYRDVDWEIGPVLEVDAFDVPESVAVAVSQRLGTITWPAAFAAMTSLSGIIHDFESAERRAELPPDTVWYLPVKAAARTHLPKP